MGTEMTEAYDWRGRGRLDAWQGAQGTHRDRERYRTVTSESEQGVNASARAHGLRGSHSCEGGATRPKGTRGR